MIVKLIELSNGKKFELHLLSARCVEVVHNHYVEFQRFDNDIVSIQIANEANYGIGDEIEFQIDKFKTKFKIAEINETQDKGIIMTCSKRTLASYFIMPLLGFNALKFSWNKYFLNCYCSDRETILLEYRFMPENDYRMMEDSLTKLPSCIRIIDDNSTLLIEFRFKYSEMSNYQNFLDGKYSQFTNDYKNYILKFHGFDKKGFLGQVLWRDCKRKEQLERELDCVIPDYLDLLSKPDLSKEVINLI